MNIHLPVKRDPASSNILDGNGKVIATAKLPGNAAEIVQALNSFEELRGALAAAYDITRAVVVSADPDKRNELDFANSWIESALKNSKEGNPVHKGVYIVVKGGVVRSVYSRTPGLDVEIMDYDDVEDDDSAEEELRRQETVLIKHAYEAY